MSKRTGLAASLKQKKEIDLTVLQQNVNHLHHDVKLTSVQQPLEYDLQKFQVYLPKEVHKKIKFYCIQEELNMKDFSTGAIIDKAKLLGVI
jgi:hypothetical protein